MIDALIFDFKQIENRKISKKTRKQQQQRNPNDCKKNFVKLPFKIDFYCYSLGSIQYRIHIII